MKSKMKVVVMFLLSGILLLPVCSFAQMNNDMRKEAAINIIKAFDSGMVDMLGQYVKDDLIEHQPSPDLTTKSGLSGLKEIFVQFHKIFPDMKTTIHSIGVAGDTLFVYNTSVGTASQEFMGTKAGDQTTFTGIDVLRFEGNKVAEHWGFLDSQLIMQMVEASKKSPMTQK